MKCAGVMKLNVTRCVVDEPQPLARVPVREDHRGRADEQRRHDVAARTGVVRGPGQQVHVVGGPAPERDLPRCALRPRPVEACRARHPWAGRWCPTCRRPGARLTGPAACRSSCRRRERSTRSRSSTSTLAAESSTMYATSSGLRCVFTSTTEPCNFATAAHTSKNATEFGSMIATRSPAPTPRVASPWAMRSVRASKSTYAVVRSCSMKAGFSGVRAAVAVGPNSGGSIRRA